MLASTRLAVALLCALGAASAVHAQQRASRSVQAAPNPVPSAAARIAQTAPNPTGLRPRFPAGVSSGSGAAVSTDPLAASTTPIPPTGASVSTTTLIPTELPPGTTTTTVTTPGFLVPGATTVVTPATIPAPGTVLPPGTIVAPGTTLTPGTSTFGAITTPAIATNVLGAGATVRGPGQTVGGAAGFSATDQARSFFFADGNHDGDLTRAEFTRLSIATMTFEEMDRNYDGRITRFEYEDSMR
jgi:hypothetical protein